MGRKCNFVLRYLLVEALLSNTVCLGRRLETLPPLNGTCANRALCRWKNIQPRARAHGPSGQRWPKLHRPSVRRVIAIWTENHFARGGLPILFNRVKACVTHSAACSENDFAAMWRAAIWIWTRLFTARLWKRSLFCAICGGIRAHEQYRW